MAKKAAWKPDTAKCVHEVWKVGTFPVLDNGLPDLEPGTPFEVIEHHGDTMELRYLTEE